MNTEIDATSLMNAAMQTQSSESFSKEFGNTLNNQGVMSEILDLLKGKKAVHMVSNYEYNYCLSITTDSIRFGHQLGDKQDIYEFPHNTYCALLEIILDTVNADLNAKRCTILEEKR
ncbi:MAG: hypothetical protein O3A01_04630 [bacterium]|nr:hypothetical protein [bacterium]